MGDQNDKRSETRGATQNTIGEFVFQKGDFNPLTLYEKLNLTPSATSEEIDNAFERAARIVDPATNKGYEDGKAYEKITRARAILLDTQLREDYDQLLLIHHPASRSSTVVQADIRGGHIRPDYRYHRLGILVIDGSGSMEEIGRNNKRKRDQVASAVKNLVDKLRVLERKYATAYSLAFVYFNEGPIVIQPAEVSQVTDPFGFDPVKHTNGGSTRVDRALDTAHGIARNFVMSPSRYQHAVPSATIIALSDGICHAPQDTLAVAKTIRETVFQDARGKDVRISIKSAYFHGIGMSKSEADAARALMLEITGKPDKSFYSDVEDANALERFYLHSIVNS